MLISDLKKSPEHKILSLNAQSINNKFQKLRDMVQSCNPTVLCIQEMWGRNPTTDYSIRGYHKPEIKTRKGNMNSGGGVGIWVREDIDFETITSPYVEKTIETLTILLIWSEWRLTVIAATVRIALVDILDLSEVDIPAGEFLYPAVGWG